MKRNNKAAFKKKAAKNRKPLIYLASKSPRRRQLLRRMRVRFRPVHSYYLERNIKGVQPEELVLRHAWGKVRNAVLPEGARYVLGADTIVWCRGRILGKPRDESEAAEILRFISNRMHVVYTGVVLYDHKTEEVQKKVSRTKVRIKFLSEDGIMEYLKKVHPYDKAGAYAIQHGPRIVKNIEGSYTNVMGLPVESVRRMIKNLEEG